MKDLPNRIRKARLDLGMSQAQFAQALGASQGSISKWENGREVPGGQFILQMVFISDKTFDFFVENPREYIPEGGISAANSSIIGIIDAKFREDEPLSDSYKFHLITIMPWVGQSSQAEGYIVKGDRANKLLHDGDVAFVVPLEKWSSELAANDTVLVKRTDADGRLELSLRRFDRPEKPWLWPLTDDPEYQTPIMSTPGKPGPNTVTVVGLVVATHRIEPAAWRSSS